MRRYMLSRFHVHYIHVSFFYIQTYMCWPRTMWTDISIFGESETFDRVADWSVCWWYQNQFKPSSKPTKMTYHVAFGSRYRLDDTGAHIVNLQVEWCSRRSCPNGGFNICERPWRYHAIESPCLVTELLLRRLADSTNLLQNSVNIV